MGFRRFLTILSLRPWSSLNQDLLQVQGYHQAQSYACDRKVADEHGGGGGKFVVFTGDEIKHSGIEGRHGVENKEDRAGG
jgi:hypothetical protein